MSHNQYQPIARDSFEDEPKPVVQLGTESQTTTSVMSHHRYQPIARDSFEDEPKLVIQLGTESQAIAGDEDFLGSPNSLPLRTRGTAKWPAILATLTVLNAIISIALFFLIQTPAIPPRQLRMPSQFNGLARTIKEGTPWLSNTSIVAFPTLLQQVDQNRPSYVYPEDPRRHLSLFGTLSPEDRQLYVSPTISSIAQFKVRDYAMEKCAIKIILPRENSISESQLNETLPTDRRRDWVYFTGSMDIQVWILDRAGMKDVWIDPRTLSFKSRPRRDRLFSTLFVEAGSEAQTERFSCKSDSVLSFEVTCRDCVLDVWQDKQLPPIGLIVEQYPSML